jgi:hypothetical protein
MIESIEFWFAKRAQIEFGSREFGFRLIRRFEQECEDFVETRGSTGSAICRCFSPGQSEKFRIPVTMLAVESLEGGINAERLALES